jgi:hypothetical protein
MSGSPPRRRRTRAESPVGGGSAAPARRRRGEDVPIIAAADGSIHEQELEVMYGAARDLDVPLTIVDETLRAAASPMD